MQLLKLNKHLHVFSIFFTQYFHLEKIRIERKYVIPFYKAVGF